MLLACNVLILCGLGVVGYIYLRPGGLGLCHDVIALPFIWRTGHVLNQLRMDCNYLSTSIITVRHIQVDVPTHAPLQLNATMEYLSNLLSLASQNIAPNLYSVRACLASYASIDVPQTCIVVGAIENQSDYCTFWNGTIQDHVALTWEP